MGNIGRDNVIQVGDKPKLKIDNRKENNKAAKKTDTIKAAIIGAAAVIIAAIITGIFILMANQQNINLETTGNSGNTQVMSNSPNSQQIIEDSYKFISITEEQKQQITDDLNEMRNSYPDQEITIKFSSLNSDSIANKIINQLKPLITSAGFEVNEQIVMGTPLETRVNISRPTELSEITEEILSALSPAIEVDFDKNIEDSNNKGVIFIYIEGEPVF